VDVGFRRRGGSTDFSGVFALVAQGETRSTARRKIGTSCWSGDRVLQRRRSGFFCSTCRVPPFGASDAASAPRGFWRNDGVLGPRTGEGGWAVEHTPSSGCRLYPTCDSPRGPLSEIFSTRNGGVPIIPLRAEETVPPRATPQLTLKIAAEVPFTTSSETSSTSICLTAL
jgi:hypothetical protein